MNLIGLYKTTPVERHGDIKVLDGRVVVKSADGSVKEYILDGNGEPFLVSNDADIQADLSAIKGKLGI